MAWAFSGLVRLVAALLVLTLPAAVSAEPCRDMKMTEEAFSAWFNPRPTPDDFILPMPLGLSLVFVPVPLGTTGLYGDERTTYTMGASQPTIYETPLEVRVGSSIADRRGQSRLLMGKYEVTKAQYAAVMARGNLQEGLQILRQRTKETRVHLELDRYLDRSSTCYDKMTASLHRLLAEPLTFLSYRDYVEFLDVYNLFCVNRNDCRKILQSLGPNRDVPGFVRLPREHEWEFVARGGRDLVSGQLAKPDIQRDLPKFPAGKSIAAYAHAGNDPPVVLPIGSREPLFGFHDIYGNAQELMGNAFTAENGFGAVGGYVARGGHFGLDHIALRASRRVELTAFRTDDTTGMLDIQYFPRTGIRLAVGLPIAGAARRLGDDSLTEDFARNYVAPDQAGDTAGDTQSDARSIGNLGQHSLKIVEELDRDDSNDWFLMKLRDYGSIQVKIDGGQGLIFEIVNSRQEVLGTSSGAAALIQTGNLLPGDYWLRVRSGSGQLSSEIRYSALATRSLAPDTGIARPDPLSLSSAFSFSDGNVMQREGFVGRGDSIDTYPVFNSSRHAGMEIELQADTSLTVTLLDRRLQLIQRETVEPGMGSGKVMLAMPRWMRGFLQIEAKPPSQSVYKVRVRAKAPFDSVFLMEYPQSLSAISRTAYPDRTYEGTIAGRKKIYLPIRLTESRTVRLELSGLEADVSMAVTGRARRVISSNHKRSGTQPEFFSKTLEAGTYIVSLGLEDPSETSAFKIVYQAEVPESTVPSKDALRAQARRSAIDLGILDHVEERRVEFLRNEFNYFRFTIRGSGEQRVVLHADVISMGEEVEFVLENFSGSKLSKSKIIGAQDERISVTLTSGIYYVLLNRRGGRASGGVAPLVDFTASANGRMQEPDLSEYGRFVERRGSFSIYQRSGQCTAVTVAQSAVPLSGWRPWKPRLVVSVSPLGSSAHFSLDRSDEPDGSDLYLPWSMSGIVTGLGAIQLNWENGGLWPSTYCSPGSSEFCISHDSLTKFVMGNSLVIEGTTPRGRSARVVYSLVGYISAMQAINRLCYADADWLWNG